MLKGVIRLVLSVAVVFVSSSSIVAQVPGRAPPAESITGVLAPTAGAAAGSADVTLDVDVTTTAVSTVIVTYWRWDVATAAWVATGDTHTLVVGAGNSKPKFTKILIQSAGKTVIATLQLQRNAANVIPQKDTNTTTAP